MALLVGFTFLPLAACGEQSSEPLSIQAPPPRFNAYSQLAADVAHYHAVGDSMLADAPVDLHELKSVMTDEAALDLARSLDEAKRTGLTVQGQPKRRMISSSIKGDSATYTECVDNRDLHVPDQEASATQSKLPPETWKLHLVKKDSRWKVTDLAKEHPSC